MHVFFPVGMVSHNFGGVLTSLARHRTIWGITGIVSQYVMEINCSGNAILYLQLEINSPEKKCLSVTNLDATVSNRPKT